MCAKESKQSNDDNCSSQTTTSELVVNERAIDCDSEEEEKENERNRRRDGPIKVDNQSKGMDRPLPVAGAQTYGSCEQTNKSQQHDNHLKSNMGQTLGRGLLDSKRSITLSEHLHDVVQKRHNNNNNNNNKPVARSVSIVSGNGGEPKVSDEDDGECEQLGWLQRAAKTIPCLGIMLALCASLFLASAGMLVKMTHSVHGIQVSVFRAVIQLIVYGSVICYKRVSVMPKKGEKVAVFSRALLGAISITFSYYALRLIPLGDATTIRFSLPIWTLIVSYLVLGEPCSALKICAVAISIFGVVLIARPDDCIYLFKMILYSLHLESDEQFQLDKFEYQNIKSKLQPIHLNPNQEPYQQLTGCCLALSSSICLALSLIALRLCKRTSAEITIFWLSILCVTIGSATLLILGEWRLPDNLPDVLFILLNGICGSIGQWFITSALKIEQSGVISLARTFDIEIAFLYSAFFLHEQIRPTSILGSMLISSGVIAVVVPKWLGSRNGAQVEERHLAHERSSEDSERGEPIERKLPEGRV